MRSVGLNPLDAAWVLTWTRATPNHVGGLLQFRLPEGGPGDFLRQLMTEFRGHREFKSPWNRRLKYAVSVNPLPVWVEIDDIDLKYHVRRIVGRLPGRAGARARDGVTRAGVARASSAETTANATAVRGRQPAMGIGPRAGVYGGAVQQNCRQRPSPGW
jgi:hypothetical protein